jgi:hypothetical protein
MVLLIIIVIFYNECIVQAGTTPSLISGSKYYKENIRIFDDTYSVGVWDLKFDEKLYGYQSIGSSQCFSNLSCHQSDDPCEPCDWTDPLICSGQIRGPNSTCPCGTPPLACFPSLYTFGSSVWPKGSNFTVIEIFDGGVVDIAYYSKPPNNCSRTIFKVDVDDGVMLGMLLYNGNTWRGSDTFYILSRHGTITVCPSDTMWGQTYVARLIGSGPTKPYAKIRISVEYQDLPTTVHSPICKVPISLTSTHQCLPTGIDTILSPLLGSSHIRVVIDPPPNERCGVLGFWADSDEHLLSTDMWVSPTNSTNALRTHREGSYDGRIWPSLYSYCLNENEKLYAYILSNTKVEFMIDTSKDWMIFRSFSEFGRTDFYKRFFGAITVNCQNNNYTAHRSIYTISESMDTGSANLRMIYPSDDIDIFYPPPLFASDRYYSVFNISTQDYKEGRIIVSLLLNQRLSSKSRPVSWSRPWFQSSYQWLTTEQWNQCSLMISNLITGVNGEGLNININSSSNIDEGLFTCESDSYINASKQIDDIQNQITDSTNQSDIDLAKIYRLWFLRDRIASNNLFYACKNKIKSYFTTSLSQPKIVNTDKCVAIYNTSEFNEDPCCGINETCSIGQRTIIDQYEIEGYTDLISSCLSIECARVSMTEYLLQLNLDKDPTACTNLITVPDEKNVYWNCVNKIWGPEPISFAGPECIHDIDCPSSICDIYSKRCFININEAEIELISCIYDGLTQFTRTSVSNELSLNPADSNIKNLWFNKFADTLVCSDPHTPLGFDIYVGFYGKCYGCERYIPGTNIYMSDWAPSPGQSWPNFGYDCWAAGSASCSISTAPFGAKSYCMSQGCNTAPREYTSLFPYVNNPSICANNTFCGISDDMFFYNDVTSIIPISNCNNSVLCILANGTKIKTTSEDECKSIFSCDTGSSLCDGKICDQNACLNSGYCSDSTDYNIGIWRRIFNKETSGCFFTIRYREPFNPTVSVCEPPFRNTILGCSVYPGGSVPEIPIFAINQSSCVSGTFEWGDPSIFTLINPRWITVAKTQQDCINYGTFCELDEPIPAGLDTYTNIYSFNNECANTQNLFKWTAGRWLPGQPRRTVVVTSNVSTRFKGGPRIGLNLPRILSNLSKAVDKLESLKAQSSAFCYNSYKKSLDELICICVNDKNRSQYNDTFCYQSKGNVTTVGVACDADSTIIAGDLQLIFSTSSLPLATCENLYISAASIVTYQNRDIIPLRTLLVNYQEDSEYAIRNQQLAIYGKVLTTGYSADFNAKITNITLCIKLSPLRDSYINQLDKYPIIDIAKRSINSLPDDLIPLDVNITLMNETNVFCAQLNKFEANQIYYFIQRMNQSYITVERLVFSSGEIAYISVLLAFYCFGLMAIIIRSIYLIYVYIKIRNIGYAPLRLGIVLFFMACFFIFRIVLFSFLLTKVLLDPSATRAINYLLFEFPLLLYFAFVTNYICIWITLLTVLKNYTVDHQKKFRIANSVSIFVNIAIFILFIIIIILFQTIISSPYYICGGTILLYDTNQSFALLLSYRIIFSVIAVILGITLFITSIKLIEHLDNPENNYTWFAKARLYIISIAGGLGLIAQAIYFLIITATQSTPINYVSLTILLIVEIIPALLFIFVEPIPNPKKTSSSGSTSGYKK